MVCAKSYVASSTVTAPELVLNPLRLIKNKVTSQTDVRDGNSSKKAVWLVVLDL
jgi:hypothetical protein